MSKDKADPPRKLSKQGSLSYLEQSLSMMSTPQIAPITIYPGPSSRLVNLSKADLEIAARLQKLRKKSIDDIPSEEEMAVRLARLKGLPMDHYTKSHIQPPELRTQVEKADDLFSQVAAEVSLEAKSKSANINADEAIEERLARLRTDNSSTIESPMDDQNPYLSSFDKDDIDIDEITKMVAQEESEAKKEVKALDRDAELAAVIAEACKEMKYEKEQKRRKHRRRTDEERFSNSDSDRNSDKEFSVEDKAEVDRIVEMYQQKARLKAERKKKLKAENKTGSDSSSLSSESDILTSESEKLSDDDSD